MPSSPVMHRHSPVETVERQFNLASAFPIVGAIALVLLVAAPWLAPGYLFGTDWPGPRRFDLPSEISSSAPLQVILVAISLLVGPAATGKILVLAALVGGAMTAFRAIPTAGVAGRAVAATLYVANPFVFGRLHYGQLYLLAGYALLPWVAARLRGLSAEPNWRGALLLALSVSLVGVFTEHLFLLSCAMIAIGVLVCVALANDRMPYIKSLAPPLGLAAVATLVLTSYWVGPFLVGKGAESVFIAGTGAGQLHAYAAVADPNLGLLPNLLGLYGFWAESSGRFTSMKAFVPLWPIALVAIVGVSAIGAVGVVRGSDRKLRAWVAALAVAGVAALILEMGVSHPLTAGLVQWLDSSLPVYRGMRDAGKWAALLALVYSQLFGLGVNEITERIRKLELQPTNVEWVGVTAVGLLIALPLYYGNGLLFGMHGEIKPSAYPAGWYAADRVLSSDPHPGRTLFLPWHKYMAYSFIQNQNRVVACPATNFFSVPIVSSSDAEIPGVAPPSDSDQLAVFSLVQAGTTGDWSHILAGLGVKYILVAREVDWKSFEFLTRQDGLALVGDYATIIVYRNTLLT
jgi:hypothetical protein